MKQKNCVAVQLRKSSKGFVHEKNNRKTAVCGTNGDAVSWNSRMQPEKKGRLHADSNTTDRKF